MTTQLVSNYSLDDLQDTTKQKEVFREMLRRLENEGRCHYVFHTLARVLFDDDLFDDDLEG